MKSFVRSLLSLPVLLAAGGLLFAGPSSLSSGRNTLSMKHDGRERSAIVIVPAGAAPAEGWPLVLMMHGGGGSAEHLARNSSWVPLVNSEGIVLVLPNGTARDEAKPAAFGRNPRTWNDGPFYSPSSKGAAAKGVDDCGFLIELIDKVAAETKIDATRVYASGHSNGSAMSYRLAAEHPTRFAAVGVVAGQFRISDPPRSEPVPLLQITGDSDPLVPLEGGSAGFGRTRFETPPAISGPERWAKLNGVSAPPTVVRDDKTVTERRWGTEGSRGEVRFVVIKGHGHTWPGDSSPLPERMVGPDSKTVEATPLIWEFFKSHRRPR